MSSHLDFVNRCPIFRSLGSAAAFETVFGEPSRVHADGVQDVTKVLRSAGVSDVFGGMRETSILRLALRDHRARMTTKERKVSDSKSDWTVRRIRVGVESPGTNKDIISREYECGHAITYRRGLFSVMTVLPPRRENS
jgi:hypothetical protein